MLIHISEVPALFIIFLTVHSYKLTLIKTTKTNKVNNFLFLWQRRCQMSKVKIIIKSWKRKPPTAISWAINYWNRICSHQLIFITLIAHINTKKATNENKRVVFGLKIGKPNKDERQLSYWCLCLNTSEVWTELWPDHPNMNVQGFWIDLWSNYLQSCYFPIQFC